MKVRRRTAIALPVAAWFASQGRAAGRPILVGAYDSVRMKSIKNLTFPRVMVYDKKGKLIAREFWPSALAAVEKTAGDAFCCVSDKPPPPGSLGPPPDCKVLVYGENLAEHFDGLKNADGEPISYRSLPSHQYLVVEYYASWCAPCMPARKALEAFLSTPAAQGYLALVVDFSKYKP